MQIRTNALRGIDVVLHIAVAFFTSARGVVIAYGLIGAIGAAACLWMHHMPSAKPLESAIVEVPATLASDKALLQILATHPADRGWQVDAVTARMDQQVYVMKRYSSAVEEESFMSALIALWTGPVLFLCGAILFIMTVWRVVTHPLRHVFSDLGRSGAPGSGSGSGGSSADGRASCGESGVVCPQVSAAPSV